ncbi:ChrR Cupin-like domain protein [compost metagenome]
MNGWVETGTPGITMKVLNQHSDGRLKTALFIVGPGVATDVHSHDVEEEVFILDGDMVEEGRTYLAGDYARRMPNGPHAVSSVSGYTSLVVYR